MSHAPTPRRVVVTGVGMVTPVGLNAQQTWASLLACRNGIDRIQSLDTEKFDVHIGGEVRDFDPSRYMDRKNARRYDRFVHFAVAAASMATEDSGLDLSQCDRERCGCVVGSGVGGILSMEEQMTRFLQRGPGRISALTIPQIMVNCAPGLIAIEMGLKGLNYAPVTACATGCHAIGLGMRHIRWGDADVVLCGGSEAGLSLLSLGGFSNMGALSRRNDDPGRASRPFDKNRDGFVIGEGAGIVMLESLEHARARGARIYAELLGIGFTDDAHHITAPDDTGEGPARAIELALAEAGRSPDQVSYINAHGTSTQYNDRVESVAIKRALGEEQARRVKISSTKSMIGHLLGGSGGVEVAVTALSVYHQKIHGTCNYEEPDPACDLDYQPNAPTDLAIDTALTNSLGFGGHNASLCLGRYQED